LRGGFNTYGYVFQNPVRGIDPLGLATAVIVGGPTSGNPAGHTAVATTGHGVESFGTQTPSGSSLTDYLENQAKYRSSTVYIIATTPEQEAAIRDRLSQFPVDLPGVPSFDSDDTCATRTNSALSAAGLYDPSNPWATLGSVLGIHSPLPEATGATGNHYSRGNNIPIPQGAANIPESLNEFNP
jgi:uncharacterized protein RhaS with RHS repeats